MRGVALVTGGNGGIGLGMAKGLAQAGAAVVIAARNASKSAAAAEELQQLGARVATVEVDVQDQASVKRMAQAAIDRFERIDVLVANAGINIRKPPQDYTAEEWQQVLDVNLNGPFYCAQAVYPHMKAQGGGKIGVIAGGVPSSACPMREPAATPKVTVRKIAAASARRAVPEERCRAASSVIATVSV